MTEKEFQECLAAQIAFDTIDQTPEVPVHYYSGFIDGKLYLSKKGKTVWTRKCDVTNSFLQSGTYETLKDRAEELCVEAHPVWFEPEKNYYNRPRIKSMHYGDVDRFVDSFIKAWTDKHFEIREVFKIEE